MCFSSQKKYEKDFFKIYYNKKLKENLSKAQLYLISNKELISRNYEKLKNIKKNTFHNDNNKDNNKIEKLFQKTPKLLNNSCLNNSKAKNLSINNYNSNENKLVSSYSFHGNSFSPINDSKNNYKNNNNNKYFNTNSKIKKLKNNLNNLNKIQKNNSSLNMKNISIINKNNRNNKTNSYNNLNKKINRDKTPSGITRNNINKKNNFKKITKFPLSPGVSKRKSLNLNITTRQKSIRFSRSPSINSSTSNMNSNINNNMSHRNDINNNIENYFSKNKKCKNRSCVKYNQNNNDNSLFKNKLKKTFFDYINKDINKSKEKKNESINLFNKLYDKLTKKAFKEIKPLFKMKSKRSSSYSNLNIFKYNYNNKNHINLINNNDVATSGSINYSFQEELSSEEIHFKAVKYYQEIKKEKSFID